MKKLILMALLVAFAAGCTQNSIEDDDYENGIQLIDKDEYENPRDTKIKDKQGD